MNANFKRNFFFLSNSQLFGKKLTLTCRNALCKMEREMHVNKSHLFLIRYNFLIAYLWLKAQHSENEDHGIQSHHFMGNRWGNSGTSG